MFDDLYDFQFFTINTFVSYFSDFIQSMNIYVFTWSVWEILNL